MGIPEVEAKYVDEELGRGNVLIGIESHKDRVDMLKESLDTFEPKKVSVSEKQDLSNMTLDKTSEFYKIEFNLDPKFGSPEGE
jgi:hypothetical protein